MENSALKNYRLMFKRALGNGMLTHNDVHFDLLLCNEATKAHAVPDLKYNLINMNMFV